MYIYKLYDEEKLDCRERKFIFITTRGKSFDSRFIVGKKNLLIPLPFTLSLYLTSMETSQICIEIRVRTYKSSDKRGRYVDL